MNTFSRIRPRIDGAPPLPPALAELFEFVWTRKEESARRAAQRHDQLMQNFALRSLRHLTDLRHWLDGETIGAEVARTYLGQIAGLYRTHPDFRAEWDRLY